jgi:hypothetical protein
MGTVEPSAVVYENEWLGGSQEEKLMRVELTGLRETGNE